MEQKNKKKEKEGVYIPESASCHHVQWQAKHQLHDDVEDEVAQTRVHELVGHKAAHFAAQVFTCREVRHHAQPQVH